MDTKKRELISLGLAWLGLRRSLTDKYAKALEDRVNFKSELADHDQQAQEQRLQELARELDYLKREYESKELYIEELIAQKLKLLEQEGFQPIMEDRPKKPKLRLGDMMVSEGWITQLQLEEAMEYQRKNGGRLGDIVAELGFIDKHRIAALMEGQEHKGRLGDMLVSTGAISQADLNKALDFQRKSGGMLGDILMSMRIIEPEKLYRHIATQNNLGRIGSEFDFEDLIKLPEYLARQYDAVVIKQDLNRYLVAVGGPLSAEAKRAIEAMLELPIEQVLATREEMEYFWKQIYQSELMIESTLKLVNEQPQNSAHVTFTTPQIMTAVAAVLMLISFVAIDWFHTLIVVNIMIQTFYFSMTLFKFLIVMYGTRDYAQIRFTKEQVDAVDERTLPIYTILVPMYKESQVIPHLLGNIEQLDYPKAKLDVRLLIEEDDVEAQQLLKSMNLPAYYTTMVVPHSLPKTKPKACNYGLIRARGEYVVIYDAEDRPDSDQLKKVHAAFSKGPDNLACIQAKLNYFNSGQNLLTRWFTHEYSMWFELLLPGVMQLNIPIPLGGTSNHFKMSLLKEINAWDPYNVTEDADLGIRLYKSGYTTAIVDSRTWEEANSRTGNWIRQRSRWIKGYMQTWLVHMRNPWKLYKELGFKGFMGFQVMVLATPILPLLNPIYWFMIILWYGWKVNWIPLFFPGIVYYAASVEFLIGNFLFVLSNVAGVYWVINELEKRNENVFSYGLVKFALLTPFYWVLMSIAAIKAAWQLITKPFYWEKTTHGLSKQQPAPVGGEVFQEGG